MAEDAKAILRDNVRLLLGIAPGESGVARVMSLGFQNGTASRILKAETSVGVDIVADLAKALGLQPWQLLVPDLDPERLPSLAPVAFRWPFRKIDPEVITGLVGAPAQAVENGLLSVLATAGVSPRKQSQAA